MPSTVLVIDDDSLVRWSLGVALAAMGFRVLHAGSGAEALLLARAEPVGAAVVDWSLPDTNGLELLKQLTEACPGCRLLLLSAYLSEDLVARASAAGAVQVLAKPFEVDDVVQRVVAELQASIRMGG